MSIKSFHQFINESAQPVGTPIFPSHEELSGLKWFRALERVLATIEIEVKWNTGRVAYERGSRELITRYDDSRENQKIDTFRFYPKTGTIYWNQFTMKPGTRLDSLADWNEAIFAVYCKVVAGLLGLPNLTRLKSAILTKDSAQLVSMFNEVNERRRETLPEEFLFAILEEVFTPEEVDAIQDLLDLGLL